MSAPGGLRRGVMLALATVGFAVNFWAWALLSPLAPKFKDASHLTSFQQALLVAVPVVVGSLGRIPVGALTDRFGGRVMFPLVSLATIVPVLYLGLAGHASLAGAAGRRVLPRHRRHRVRGRRAVRQRLVPARAAGARHRRLRRGHGRHRDQRADHGQAGRRRTACATPFVITAVVLAAYAVLAALLLRDAPGRAVPTEPLARRLAATCGCGVTWQASALYAVAFGGYVAFSVYLPAYLKTALRAHPGRRRQPDGRVRAARGG